MHILIVTNHFYPEVFRVTDIARSLVMQGHEVTVITQTPNYPEGRFFKGYGWRRRRKEVVYGATVIRVPVIPRGSGTWLLLALNYLSYLLGASIVALYLGLSKRYDRIFVQETSPVTVALPAIIVKRLQHIPLYMWVLDLWPESLSAGGGITNRRLLSLFGKLTSRIYRRCDKLLISSPGYATAVIARCREAADKLVYFPHWAEEHFFEPHALPEGEALPMLPDGFRVILAGNLGEAQDLEAVVKAAKCLKGSTVRLILVGDGRKRCLVERCIDKQKLHDNMCVLGRCKPELMPHILAKADALLVSLKGDTAMNLTFPARMQAYMASGRPIVAMLDGVVAGLLQEADCGWHVPSSDYKALADRLLMLSCESPEELQRRGNNARRYAESHYRFDKAMANLKGIMELI